jgi:hypothetical protein
MSHNFYLFFVILERRLYAYPLRTSMINTNTISVFYKNSTSIRCERRPESQMHLMRSAEALYGYAITSENPNRAEEKNGLR